MKSTYCTNDFVPFESFFMKWVYPLYFLPDDQIIPLGTPTTSRHVNQVSLGCDSNTRTRIIPLDSSDSDFN